MQVPFSSARPGPQRNSCHRLRSIKFSVYSSALVEAEPFADTNSLKWSLFIIMKAQQQQTSKPTSWRVAFFRRASLWRCQPRFNCAMWLNRHFIKGMYAGAGFEEEKLFALSSWCSCSRDKYWNCKNIYCESFSALPFVCGAFVLLPSHRSSSTDTSGECFINSAVRLWANKKLKRDRCANFLTSVFVLSLWNPILFRCQARGNNKTVWQEP